MTWKQQMRVASRVRDQISHYLNIGCRPNVPQWYETRRKTTHVIFWS